jgi:hypothetical protein
VQAIGLLDDLDKELNTYAMRVREWYGWHFPEMTKIVADNIAYAKAVSLTGKRAAEDCLFKHDAVTVCFACERELGCNVGVAASQSFFCFTAHCSSLHTSASSSHASAFCLQIKAMGMHNMHNTIFVPQPHLVGILPSSQTCPVNIDFYMLRCCRLSNV